VGERRGWIIGGRARSLRGKGHHERASSKGRGAAVVAGLRGPSWAVTIVGERRGSWGSNCCGQRTQNMVEGGRHTKVAH
jgi:hypothetical protein